VLRPPVRLILLTLLGLLAIPTASHAEYDECDAGFIAFLGADAYQFSPALPDGLGTVRLYTVLSFQRAAAEADFGRAFWRLEIRGPVRLNGLGQFETGACPRYGRFRSRHGRP
jgi:hypothetical protein